MIATVSTQTLLGSPHLPPRFWAKVRVNPQTGCWEWTASLFPNRYARFGMRDDGRPHSVTAHRLAYIALVGAPPAGLVLDHLCRVRHCVNPGHMEPVTIGENTRRGLLGELGAQAPARRTCGAGHAYDEMNTYVSPQGRRGCRECNRAAVRRYAERKRREVAA